MPRHSHLKHIQVRLKCGKLKSFQYIVCCRLLIRSYLFVLRMKCMYSVWKNSLILVQRRTGLFICLFFVNFCCLSFERCVYYALFSFSFWFSLSLFLCGCFLSAVSSFLFFLQKFNVPSHTLHISMLDSYNIEIVGKTKYKHRSI